MSDQPVPPPPPSTPPPPPPSAPPPPTSPSGGSGDGGTVSENRQVMTVLSYLWLLALIPFLMEKDDREVQWHAKHGLVLLGAEIILGVVLMIINMVTSCLGCVLTIPIWLVVLGIHGAAIYKGWNGERFLIPGLSDLADQF